MRQQVADETLVVRLLRILGDQYLVICSVPPPRPILIRPAKAIRKVRPARRSYFLDRPLEQPLAGKPVVVIAECVDRMRPREAGLLLPDFGNPQVIKPEIRGQVRLIMADEIRTAPASHWSTP